MLVGQALAKMEPPVTIWSASIHAHVLFTTKGPPAPQREVNVFHLVYLSSAPDGKG